MDEAAGARGGRGDGPEERELGAGRGRGRPAGGARGHGRDGVGWVIHTQTQDGTVGLIRSFVRGVTTNIPTVWTVSQIDG